MSAPIDDSIMNVQTTTLFTLKPRLQRGPWLVLNLVNVTEAWYHPARSEIGLNITVAALHNTRHISHFSLQSGSDHQILKNETLKSTLLEKSHPEIAGAAQAWYRFKAILGIGHFLTPTLIAHFSDSTAAPIATLDFADRGHPTATWKTSSVHDLLLVHGMHRSGTSATAQAMVLSGCKLPGKTLEPNQWNPDGYFEPVELVRIHDEALKRLGRTWYDPSPLPDDWIDSSVYADLVKNLDRFLNSYAKENTKATLIKDPRITYFYQAWQESLEKLGIRIRHLVIVRPVEEVVASLYSRDKIPAPISSLLWMSTNIRLARWLHNKPHTLASYASITQDASTALKQIIASIDCPQLALSNDAVASIKPNLNHFDAPLEGISEEVIQYSNELNMLNAFKPPTVETIQTLNMLESELSRWYQYWREPFEEYHQLRERSRAAIKILEK